MTQGSAIRESNGGVSFAVRVSPRASRTQFTGTIGEGADAVFKIALAAPPVDGRANDALISFLADLLRVSRSSIEVVSGQQSRNKVVRIKGCNSRQVRDAFKPDKKA